MNVTVENLAPCKKLLRVELDAKAVDEAFESMTREFQRQVSLPGFRPGKAPRNLVEKKYAEDIQEEVKKKLIPDAYRKALQEQKLEVVGYPDIEEIQFGRGQNLQFAATVETAPEFEMPDYKGLPAKMPKRSVTNDDVEKAIAMLRDRKAEFKTVTRPAQANDILVINYTGTVEGKPITETAPTAKGLTEQKNFWVEIRENSFIPGFANQLIGASAGEKRTVNVEFPEDFVTPALAKKQGVYQVEVVEVKEKSLPEINDEFAKSYGAEGLDKLREGVRADLENELKYKQGRDVREQLVRALLDRVSCDLPESVVMAETRNVIYNIVQENQRMGVSKEAIDEQKDKIFSAANTSAKDRVKASFLFQKIAEKEGIKIENNEMAQRIGALAQRYNIPPDKFVKDLQKRNGFGEIHEQLIAEKVLDLLSLHAKVEEIAETAESAAPVGNS